jgi:hypothetical protein
MNDDLNNVIDMHVHSAPSLFPRQFDDFYLGKMAVKNNMAGFILKDHDSITSNRAYLVNKYLGTKKAYGSMVFNHSQGGFNEKVFRTAIDYGIKIAWMPTNQSLYHIKNFGNSDYSKFGRTHSLPPWPGLTILNKAEKIKSSVLNILDLAKDNSLCIGSGHLSASEILAMVNSSPLELRQKMIITHVNWSIFRLKNEEIENLKTKGVYFELTLAPVYSSQFKSQSIKDILKLIYLIGIDKCIISSDLGQIGSIDPMKAINKACDELRKEGLNDNQIEKLFSYNAGKFLDF